MKKTILIMLTLLLTACVTEKKATKYFKVHDDKLAELCHERFPVSDVEFIPGEEIIKEVVRQIPGEVIPCPEPTTENPRPVVKCPACEEIIREIHRTDTIKVKDTREIFIYQNELKASNQKNEFLQDENLKLKEQLHRSDKLKSNLMWIIILLCVSTAGYVGFKIFK